MQPPYQPLRENISSYLNSLLLRHQGSERHYQDFAAACSELPKAVDFFQELAAYRRKLANELSTYLSENNLGSHTLSRQSRTYLAGQSSQMGKAMETTNLPQLSSLTYENENALIHYFTEVMGKEGLPEDIEKLFAKQLEKVREMVIKADRFQRVN
ncbi:MAG: hypothetical protein AAF433_15140 [Bacteroidota bacterium]